MDDYRHSKKMLRNLFLLTGVSPRHTPLLVLKLPHSGSTWLANSLSSLPNVYLVKEGLTKFSMSATPISEVERYLIRALRGPTGTFLAPSKLSLPRATVSAQSSRTTWNVVGCSVCPIINAGTREGGNWSAVVKPRFKQALRAVLAVVPRARVIIYYRSNAVKQTLSSSSSSFTRHHDRRMLYIEPEILLGEARLWLQRGAMLQELRFSCGKASGVLVLAYEALQLDTTGELMRSIATDFLQMPPADVVPAVSKGQFYRSTGGVKLASEDLRERLQNFHAVSAHLEAFAPCLVEQLHSPSPRIFGPCRAENITNGFLLANHSSGGGIFGNAKRGATGGGLNDFLIAAAQ